MYNLSMICHHYECVHEIERYHNLIEMRMEYMEKAPPPMISEGMRMKVSRVSRNTRKLFHTF
jgi:hypothetical protein